MAKQRPKHHPPISGTVHRPESENPGYIYGSLAIAGFGCRDFYIAQIPRKQAVAIIIERHYSRRIVNNSYIHLGVFIGGELLGVLQFGYALVARAMGKVVEGTQVDEYLELNRMWLDDRAPRNSESRALSYCFKYIRKACPRVRWVQSFADERCGGLGVVYQAANFLFVGSHLTRFFELDGEVYHDMLLTAHKKPTERGRHLRANLGRASMRLLRQFRYVYFFDRRDMARLKMRPRPYPKRGR